MSIQIFKPTDSAKNVLNTTFSRDNATEIVEDVGGEFQIYYYYRIIPLVDIAGLNMLRVRIFSTTSLADADGKNISCAIYDTVGRKKLIASGNPAVNLVAGTKPNFFFTFTNSQNVQTPANITASDRQLFIQNSNSDFYNNTETGTPNTVTAVSLTTDLISLSGTSALMLIYSQQDDLAPIDDSFDFQVQITGNNN